MITRKNPNNIITLSTASEADIIAAQANKDASVDQYHMHNRKGGEVNTENNPRVFEKLITAEGRVIEALDSFFDDESLPVTTESKYPSANKLHDGRIMTGFVQEQTTTVDQEVDGRLVYGQKKIVSNIVGEVGVAETRINGQHETRVVTIIEGNQVVRLFQTTDVNVQDTRQQLSTSIALYDLRDGADLNAFGNDKPQSVTMEQFKQSEDVEFVTIDQYGYDDVSYFVTSLKENDEKSLDVINKALDSLSQPVSA